MQIDLILCLFCPRTLLYDPERGYKGENREELGLEFLVDHYTWKQLPHAVFELYGGRQNAIVKGKRAAILEQKAAIEAQAALMSPAATGGATSLGKSHTTPGDRLTATGGAAEEESQFKRQRVRAGSVDLDNNGGSGGNKDGINRYEKQLERALIQYAALPQLQKPAPKDVHRKPIPIIAKVIWKNLNGEP